MDDVEEINRALVLALNAAPDAPRWLEYTARFSAEWVVYILPGILTFIWMRGGEGARKAVIYAGSAAAIALVVNFLIALIWFHPRPFMPGLGIKLLAHSPDTSFPSDHATLAFALGFGLLAGGGAAVAILTLAGALVIAWSRVYVGVHFPIDMVGSLAVAAAATLVLRSASSVMDGYLLPRVLDAYRTSCGLLRLPVRLFRP